MNYTATILSLITGFVFTIMVTRKLTVYEYGLWSIISNVIAISCYPYLIYGYWVTRYVARGVKGTVKTGLFLSVIFLACITPVYIVISLFYEWTLDSNILSYFIASIFYFYCMYLWYFWRCATAGFAPEIQGYGIAIGEIIKVSLGYYLIIKLKLGLWGVIFTLTIVFFIMDLVGAYGCYKHGMFSREHKVDKLLAKKWLRNFFVPMIDSLSSILLSCEQIVISVISRSTIPSAFLQISRVATLPILYGSALASGLYARLLAKAKLEDLKEILRMIFSVNNFVLATIMILASPLLSLFNPKYIMGTNIVIIFAIVSYIEVLIRVFNTTLIGIEKIDIKEDISYKELLKSYLVKSPLIIMIRNLMAVVLSIILLSLMNTKEPHYSAFLVAISWLLVSLPALIIFIRLIRRIYKGFVPWKDLVLSLLALIPSIGYYLLFKVYTIRVLIFGKHFIILIFHVAMATLLYFSALFIISKWFRRLCITALKFIISRTTRLI